MSIPDELELPASIFERTLALLEELVRESSASDDRAGLERMARRLGDALAARGLGVEIHGRPPRPGAKSSPRSSRAPARDPDRCC